MRFTAAWKSARPTEEGDYSSANVTGVSFALAPSALYNHA